MYHLLGQIKVNEAKPIKFLFDAHNSRLIFIFCVQFSCKAVLIFNAKVEHVIFWSHLKKWMGSYTQFIVIILLNMVGQEKGPFDDFMLVTRLIFPKANTNISIAFTVTNFSVLKQFWMIIAFLSIITWFIREILTLCHFSKVMMLGCFSIKFPTNDHVTVTFRAWAEPLFITTGLIFAAPTFKLSLILYILKMFAH